MNTKKFLNSLYDLYKEYDFKSCGFRLSIPTVYNKLFSEKWSSIEIIDFIKKLSNKKLIKIYEVAPTENKMGPTYDIAITRRGIKYVENKYKFWYEHFYLAEKITKFIMNSIIIGLALMKFLELIYTIYLVKILN